MKILKRACACFIIGLFIAAVAYGVWDKDKPAAGTSLRSSNPEILANQSALQTALDAEHDFGGSTQTGSHTPGSARAFFQDDAPTTQIDGDAFAATDLGSLWFDTDATPDNLFYVLTASAGNGTWTKISVSLIAEVVATANTWGAHQTFGAGFDLKGSATSDILWNTDKFTVAGATGNTVIAGTLTQQGVATLADTSALATSGAPAADAQIANKKYVDDGIAGATTTDKDDDATTLVPSHSYKAQTSGFVSVLIADMTNENIQGFLHTSADAAGAGIRLGRMDSSAHADKGSFQFFVPNGQYFEITSVTDNPSILWTSLVSGGTAPEDQD